MYLFVWILYFLTFIWIADFPEAGVLFDLLSPVQLMPTTENNFFLPLTATYNMLEKAHFTACLHT